MPRRLHIGGETRSPDWEVLNAVPGDHVDHMGDAADMSEFDDNTFSELYASHILEHLDYVDEINQALIEWHRVLTPGGKLYISVPDLDRLAALFLDRENFTPDERFDIMRIIFGGHTSEYDYHVVGLNEEFLSSYLAVSGFVNIRRVESFGIFTDTSEMRIRSMPISVNLVAEKPAA